MLRKLHSYHNLPFTHDMCHLFEHVIIRVFLLRAQRKGQHRAFIGAINGHTIESSLFFEIEVHDPKSLQLFEQVLADNTVFSEDIIHQSLRHIEAETKSIITVNDMKKLSEDLSLVSKYINNTATDVSLVHSQLTVKEAKDSFWDITVSAGISNTDERSTKAFYCLYPVVMDIVRDAYFDTVSAYPATAASFAAYYDGSEASQSFTISRSIDTVDADVKIDDQLHSFGVSQYSENIAQMANSFRSDSTFAFLPLYCYEKTEFISTIEELASLITVDNLTNLLNNIKISITIQDD